MPGLQFWEAMGVHIVAAGCGAASSLPTLTLILAGTDYLLPPESYIIQARTSLRGMLARMWAMLVQ